MSSSPEAALKPIADAWLKKIELGATHKRKEYGDAAEECLKFFNGPYTWMYEDEEKKKPKGSTPDDEDIPAPRFQVTINKAAEVVELFGPAMYQQNPDRRVEPRRDFMPPPSLYGNPNDPNVQNAYMTIQQQVASERGADETIAQLFEAYLQYTPKELGLRRECRLAVDEALIKGMSCGWTEIVEHPSGRKNVGTFWGSDDEVIFDPDVKRYEDAMWISRECIHPVWKVERDYGWAPGTLKGNMQSANSVIDNEDNPRLAQERAAGKTNDLIRYYKIWSKMGVGTRMNGDMQGIDEKYRQYFEQVGDYCYIVVAKGVEAPLNLPPQLLESQDDQQGVDAISRALQWPVPHWLDKGAWPMKPLAYHWVPGKLYPKAHLSSAIGELRFINWVYSLLMSKIRVASRDFLVIAKDLSDEAKKAITHGPDYTVIQVSRLHDNIDKLVFFLQHPPFNPEVYKVLAEVIELFNQRTGLTDLLYGATDFQLRSAQEAEVKQTNASVRPSDMAAQVEEWATELAKNEMAAARWVLMPQDVEPVLGSYGAMLWQELVLKRVDPKDMFHQFQCSVEAGSTKRPDRNRDIKNLADAMQTLAPTLFQWASGTGQVQQFNALVADWCKANGIADAERYMLMPPMPMGPPPAPGGGGESGGGGGQEKGPPQK